jgi:hypothetical protein
MNNKPASNYKSVLFGILFFFIIIDSGGPLGIRWVSVVISIAIAFSVCLIRIGSAINSKSILLYLAAFILVLIGLISAALNALDIKDAITLLFCLLYIIIVAISFNVLSYLDFMYGLVLAGYCFVISIICSCIAYLFDIPYYSEFFINMLSNFPGSFRLHEVFGLPYILIYFQAILTLVPCTVAAYLLEKKGAFYLFLLTLVLVLSRYSVVTIIIIVFANHFMGTKRCAKVITFLFIPLSISFLLYYMAIYLIEYSKYIPTFESANVRIGHVISTYDSLNMNNLLFGQGPGSFFYTVGRLDYADNTELTQLELLRKYGLIWWSIFFVFMNTIFYRLYKIKQYELIVVLFSFVFVASSQPVLMSLSFSVLFGFGLSMIARQQILIRRT